MRCLLWVLWAITLLAVAPGAVAAPAPDPTCDFPAQATVTYRPTGDESPAKRLSGAAGATVCEHTSGAQGMEPMLAVNKRGTLFMGIATDKGLYEDPGRLTGTVRDRTCCAAATTAAAGSASACRAASTPRRAFPTSIP